MSENIKKIEEILHDVKSKIEAHKKFKATYNKQLAFDFNLFNFFYVGENKLSEILAFFLNPKGSHGQGDVFLRAFIEEIVKKDEAEEKVAPEAKISDEKFEIGKNPIIKTEKVIPKTNRRIDIYIELKNSIIAIENKIWAVDQKAQLYDYVNYLDEQIKYNFPLLYLTPYEKEPDGHSTTKEDENENEISLTKEQYKEIGYREDIIDLVSRWIYLCEADNVTYFLKAFKKYLTRKFINKNDLNMSDELKDIIKNNLPEVQTLVNEYKAIEDYIIGKLKRVKRSLEEFELPINLNLSVSKIGVHTWEGGKYYKWSISKGDNKIYVQIYQKEINLKIDYYFGGTTDDKFKKLAQDSNLRKNEKIDYEKKRTKEVVNIFKKEIEKVCQIFTDYESQKS